VLTRADAVSAPRRHEIRGLLAAARRSAPPAVWAEAEHRPVSLRRWEGGSSPLEEIRGRRVAACAAIGNPAAFRATLAALGADVVAFRALPDHHAYGAADLAALARLAADARVELVVTTLKDLVKIRRGELGGTPLAALEIALFVREGGDELAAALERAVGLADRGTGLQQPGAG
ncbi:MAG: tetraacyldisaccharide 4'-kinase, partial [Planctomycetaceae bacterium]